MTEKSRIREKLNADRAGDWAAELPMRRFLAELRPLLVENSACSAWLVGSRARGNAVPESDIDVIIVAPSLRKTAG